MNVKTVVVQSFINGDFMKVSILFIIADTFSAILCIDIGSATITTIILAILGVSYIITKAVTNPRLIFTLTTYSFLSIITQFIFVTLAKGAFTNYV